MSRTLALQVSPGEVWAALERDGELIGLRVARERAQDAVGAIYVGRIVALRPELPAALVDIGLERAAFLDARDADKQRGIAGLTEGEAMIVQVIKAARADKAAGVRLLRGRDDVAARRATPPARLDRPEAAAVGAAKALLSPLPDRILVDERGALAELKRAFPEAAPLMAFYGENTPLFDSLGVAEQIDRALQSRVAVPGGGVIHIDMTRTATMIDVDGGEQAALAANLAAGPAIARQIVLRHLAGPIVIDFVGMRKREDRDRVAAVLKAALEAEAATVEILGWTKLGHFELVRARREPALADILFERAADGAWRKTAVTLALEALGRIAREAEIQPAKSFTLVAHPEVITALADGAGLAARQSLEARLGRALAAEADPARARDAVDIRTG